MKKNISILLFLFLFSCSNKNTVDLENLITNDNIQYWNYEWNRKYPDEFGKTYSFNKNGDLLKYLYVKKSGLRQIYSDEIENPYQWSIKSDLLFIDNEIYNIHEVYKIIYFSSDTIKLVNTKYKDTSILLKETQKFDKLIEIEPNDFVLDPKTKDTVWIFTN